MYALYYVYLSIGICTIYLFVLFQQKRYKLPLPSTIHCFTWLVATSLMALELNDIIGIGSSKIHYEKVAPYIFYMMVSATIGFVAAHIITERKNNVNEVVNNLMPLEVIDETLFKYKWILYVCFFCGIIFICVHISIGGFDSLSDYRRLALSVKKVGFLAIIQKISGHIQIIGTFYIALFAYKQAISGVNFKELIKVILMYSAIGIAGGGRLWLLNSILPYGIIYLWVSHNIGFNKKDIKKIFFLCVLAVLSFTAIGAVRNDNSDSISFKQLSEKLLYYTDGPKMTNLIFNRYPPGSYDLEYGKAEFLSRFCTSKMQENFREYISYDPGLAVTTKSSIYILYFDFGYWGGIIMWGILCMCIEYLAIILVKRRTTILSLFSYLLLTLLFFQSPIFEVFNVYTPYFYWLVVIFLFRNKIFAFLSERKQFIA